MPARALARSFFMGAATVAAICIAAVAGAVAVKGVRFEALSGVNTVLLLVLIIISLVVVRFITESLCEVRQALEIMKGYYVVFQSQCQRTTAAVTETKAAAHQTTVAAERLVQAAESKSSQSPC